MNEKKLSWKSIIGYGFGEAGTQFSWTLISNYLTVFYTDVVGLTPVIISTIMLVARIWDAINDPMFGTIAERYTHTRWGRYRPYILFGAPILALTNCLTFLNLDISSGAKSFWCGCPQRLPQGYRCKLRPCPSAPPGLHDGQPY